MRPALRKEEEEENKEKAAPTIVMWPGVEEDMVRRRGGSKLQSSKGSSSSLPGTSTSRTPGSTRFSCRHDVRSHFPFLCLGKNIRLMQGCLPGGLDTAVEKQDFGTERTARSELTE